MKTQSEYQIKADELNAKYPAVKASVKQGWGGKLFIEVATIDKAKALFQMFPGFSFSCGMYR